MNLDQTVLKEAEKQGFTILPGTKHNKVYAPDVYGGQMVTVISKGSNSPDRGMVYKLIRDLRKGGFVWPPADIQLVAGTVSKDGFEVTGGEKDDLEIARVVANFRETEPEPVVVKHKEPQLYPVVQAMKIAMEQRGDSVDEVARLANLPVTAINAWLKGGKPQGMSKVKIDRYNRGVHITKTVTKPLRLINAHPVGELLMLIDRAAKQGVGPGELGRNAGLNTTQLYPSSLKKINQVMPATYNAVLAAVEALEAPAKAYVTAPTVVPATRLAAPKKADFDQHAYYATLGVDSRDYKKLAAARRALNFFALYQALVNKGGRLHADIARAAGVHAAVIGGIKKGVPPLMKNLQKLLIYLDQPMSAYAPGLDIPWPLAEFPVEETAFAEAHRKMQEAGYVQRSLVEEREGLPASTPLPTLEQLIDYVREFKKQGYGILFEIRV